MITDVVVTAGYNPSFINDLATWPFSIGFVFLLATAFAYGWPPTPWYKSLLGVAFMGELVAGMVEATIISLRRYFDAYPGYEYVAWSGHTIFAIAQITLFVVVIYTRRTGRNIDFQVPPPEKKKKL